MGTLSISAMEKILREAGSERVSKKAAIELADLLEEYGLQIGKDAMEFAKHAGRKTVIDGDIKLAKKKMSENSKKY
ncbi:MAG TPA: histone family protein [archaeon]|nr:histone family protein [archaeon]